MAKHETDRIASCKQRIGRRIEKFIAEHPSTSMSRRYSPVKLAIISVLLLQRFSHLLEKL